MKDSALTQEETAAMIAKAFYDRYPVLSLKARTELANEVLTALRHEREKRQSRHKVSCAANDPYRSLPCDCAEQEIEDLQSQLEQVTKERDDLNFKVRELNDQIAKTSWQVD